jgi:hypothetical protein
MPRNLPWDEIPDTNVVPGGLYPLKGVSLEEVRTRELGKLMYKVCVQIMDDPRVQDFSGMLIFEQFTIGSDTDPDALELNTWKKSFGARLMKQMISASQIAERADMDKICANFKDHQFIGNVSYSLDTSEEYKGTPRNRMTSYYKMGEREVGIDPKSYAEYKGGSAAGVVAPNVMAPPPPAAPGVPVGGAPAVPVQPTAPVAPVVPVQATIPGPALPTQPSTTAAPAQPVNPVPPGTPPAAEVIAGATINCPTCAQQGKPAAIPLADFNAHVQLHQTGQI